MTSLAGISGKEAIKKFQRKGYYLARQRGSHARLKHRNSANYPPLTVPLHKELGVGLLTQLIKDARIEAEEFLKL